MLCFKHRGKGQHGEVQPEYASTIARHRQTDLRRSECGRARGTGRSADSRARGSDHPLPRRRQLVPETLRAVNGYSSHTTPDRNGLGSRWETVLASLDRERAEESDREVVHRERKKVAPSPRKPTPKQIARWEAVHAAKRRGLSIRGITRETGVHRITVKKYLKADSPPMTPSRKKAGKT